MKLTRGEVAQAVVAGVGGWLMLAPSVLGHVGSDIAQSDRIVGPVVLAIGFLSIFPITRLLRWVNLLPGAWLLLAPWLLDAPTDATISSMVAGVVVLALAPVEKAPQDQYGGGWITLVRPSDRPDK